RGQTRTNLRLRPVSSDSEAFARLPFARCVHNYRTIRCMRAESNVAVRAGKFVLLGAFFVCLQATAQVVTPTNVTVRVMASNLSSGSNMRYEPPGLNILKGLKPDIACLQEFN